MLLQLSHTTSVKQDRKTKKWKIIRRHISVHGKMLAEIVISNSNCVLSPSQNNGLNNRIESHNEGNAILCTENKEKLGVLAHRSASSLNKE